MALSEDEASLITTLNMYRSQLDQVESCLQMGSNLENQEELVQLQQDLKQIILLTEQNLANINSKRTGNSDQNKTGTSSAKSLDHSPSRSDGSKMENLSKNSHGKLPNAANNDDLDEEYAAFQALLGEHLTSNDDHLTNNDDHTPTKQMKCKEDNEHLPKTNGVKYNEDAVTIDSDEDSEDLVEISDDEENGDFIRIEDDDADSSGDSDANLDDDVCGQKCSAPFSFEWGEFGYHNAMIMCREKASEDGEPMVRVLFCNPRQQKMRPCPFYLKDRCNYEDESCRYSHGEIVKQSLLKPYHMPDFSGVAIGCRCIVKQDDDIWHPATITEILEDNRFRVKFSSNRSNKIVSIQCVFPTNLESEDLSISDSIVIDDDKDYEMDKFTSASEPQNVDFNIKTTNALGNWEMHTKGIGSKLMAKMGYVAGQGLGRTNQGIAEPVPMNILPKGMSLDKIMELKSLANDDELFDALKKRKHRQNGRYNSEKDPQKQRNRKSSGHNNSGSDTLFDFINNKLHQPKGHPSSSKGHTSKGRKFISGKDLKSKSDHEISVQLLKTGDEIRNLEREIFKQNDCLERATGRCDLKSADTIKKKVESLNSYINQLKASKAFLQIHKKKRKAQDMLTKF